MQAVQLQDNGDGDDLSDAEDVTFVVATDDISPYLYRIMQESCTCKSVLAATRDQSTCGHLVQLCRDHPDQVFYTAPMSERTPFLEACLRNHCRHVISTLLEINPLAIIDRDSFRNTALHLLFVNPTAVASTAETDFILQMLLDADQHQFDHATNRAGDTVLHMACRGPEAMVHPNCLKRLIAVNPDSPATHNTRHQTPLHLHCGRTNATVRVAKILLDAKPHVLDSRDTVKGWTPIHYAASKSNHPLLRYLIARSPGSVSVRSSTTGTSALHVLVGSGDIRACPTDLVSEYLKADPAAASHTDLVHSKTPLHLLCQQPSTPPALVREILAVSRRAAAVVDSSQYLPIHYACEFGASTEVVDLLLNAYPEGAHLMTRKQDTALSLACSNNQNVETVQLLIEANQDVLTRKNDYGYAPIHCVCRAYQPRMGIVKALMKACPDCVTLKTNAGETAMHLASNNSGAFVGILKLLGTALRKIERNRGVAKSLNTQTPASHKKMTNNVGNTPLHDACFRRSSFEMIETLAMSNPAWIHIPNLAGHTPLQILIKCGRIDERTVTFFSQLGGPSIFSIVDHTGNTPLHSAMRHDVSVETISCLIRARPESLYAKTIYGDTPLHLACFRSVSPKIVHEMVIAGSCGQLSPVLVPNSSGQTPLSIVMEEFQQSGCGCSRQPARHPDSAPLQGRSFETLVIIVKVLFYGIDRYCREPCSLIHACVSLHRRNIRLDPAFIRMAIHAYPGETMILDDEGSYPLHIEAGIPIEKMSLLDSSHRCANPSVHRRRSILRVLLEMYPEAARTRNQFDEFPLSLMVQNGREWGHTMALMLRTYPQGLHWSRGVDDYLLPFVLAKAGRECGTNTLFLLLCSWPCRFPKAGEGRNGSNGDVMSD